MARTRGAATADKEGLARSSTEPVAVICEIVQALEPALDPAVIEEAVRAISRHRPRLREIAAALEADPQLLTSGRPEGPKKLGPFIKALITCGAEHVVPERCGRCGKPNVLSIWDGAVRICSTCSNRAKRAPCAGCGQTKTVATRDREGRPRCRSCIPDEDRDPLEEICDRLQAVATGLPRESFARAVREAAPSPAHQRRLAWALEADPELLTGAAHRGPRCLLTLIETAVRYGAIGLVRPTCPRCGRARRLTYLHDGARCCEPCWRQTRPTRPCTRCGRETAAGSRSVSGDLVCSSCWKVDPINHQTCTRCGRLASIERTTPTARLCSRCAAPSAAECGYCGRTVPCYRDATGIARCLRCARRARTPEPCANCGNNREVSTRLPDGAALCPNCAAVTEPCLMCGTVRRVTARTGDGQPLCRYCYPKHPASRRPCVRCQTISTPYHHGLCNACAAERQLRELLGDTGTGLRPELEPVLDALIRSDPHAILVWLHPPEPRRILRALATHPNPATHQALDTLLPSKTVPHLRAALVAGGVLPARDEQLAALERWIPHALDRIANPAERKVMRSYITWHHLRRLRTTIDDKPLSYTRVSKIRSEISAEIRLLAFLAEHETSLAACTQHEIDAYLTDEPGHALARSFLLWAVKHHHAGHVEIPSAIHRPPTDFIEADERWQLVRRLIHDESIDPATRTAGLLLLLFAQPLTQIARITLDQIIRDDGRVALLLGTAPVELPPPLDALILTVVDQRHGWAVLGRTDNHPWLFPGGRAGQPLSPQALMRRLQAFGLQARLIRNTTLLEMATELPDIVISRLLGISQNTAARWLRAAGRPDAEYAAELTRRQPFGNFQ